ncbi:hypothetical protein, partial [Xenorhabdus nematophila]|uniref:hypothetical protein n=1 Tax=Xenorhabdus nematophila TaxID=628 RepID=UPI0032B7C741
MLIIGVQFLGEVYSGQKHYVFFCGFEKHDLLFLMTLIHLFFRVHWTIATIAMVNYYGFSQ